MKQDYKRTLLICLGLAFWAGIVMFPMRSHEFLNYDDCYYITQNPHVANGLCRANIEWAFRSFQFSNWHPVTWLSLMLDCEAFGLHAGSHHLVNLGLHIANTILLFLLLHRLTRHTWRSAFVAMCFALHPLHVESVAWAAERKDVLSTFFGFSMLHAYVWYTENRRWGWYVLTGVMFALGLMAKPMLVTFPFVLLLLDFWPLGRMGLAADGPDKALLPRAQFRYIGPLVIEKLPFLALTVLSCLLTFTAQSKGKAIAPLQGCPLDIRLANAFVSYVMYAVKMFWPARLAVLYPFPKIIPLWKSLGSFLILCAVTLFALKQAGKRPWLAFGWFWYIGMLVPVIGIVQVGGQAMADRYTYVSLIGLFVIVTWGFADQLTSGIRRRWILYLLAGAVLILMSVETRMQLRHWKDSVSLFTHTLAITEDNFLTHNNLGNALVRQGKRQEAIRHYRESINIFPGHANTYNNLGITLKNTGQYTEAEQALRRAIELDPELAVAWYNLAMTLVKLKQYRESLGAFEQALNLNPDHLKARQFYGLMLMALGDHKRSEEQFRIALKAHSENAVLHYNLGRALKRQERFQEAIISFETALNLDPNLTDVVKELTDARAGKI